MNYAMVELLQFIPKYMELIQANEINTVYQLLGHGMVSPNRFISDDFISPLALACEQGHLEMAKLLWMFGASVKPELETQIPPFQAATRGGHVDIIQWLLNEVLVCTNL